MCYIKNVDKTFMSALFMSKMEATIIAIIASVVT